VRGRSQGQSLRHSRFLPSTKSIIFYIDLFSLDISAIDHCVLRSYSLLKVTNDEEGEYGQSC
jgi:hypothetical protein